MFMIFNTICVWILTRPRHVSKENVAMETKWYMRISERKD
jgi:hypothetical protein